MAVALVTGGSRGIGRATVGLLCAHGWDVVFCYCSDDDAARLVSETTGAVAVKADVSDAAQVRSLTDKVIGMFGHIDLLVNNAAISVSGLFTDITDRQWERLLAVNVNGVFNCTKSVLPHMLSRKSGRIVNISSMWGKVGASCEVHYSATKAAVIGMTRALAKEVGLSGITVNCIAPGVIDTEMNGHLSESEKAFLANETPLGRIGRPEDVAQAVEFLASDAGSFITGQVLSVDGGFAI